MKKFLLTVASVFTAAFAALTAAGCGGKTSGVKTEKILFIGNSFTYYSDVPAIFKEIADSAGKKVRVESVTQGSWNLSKFADEKDEYGKQVAKKLAVEDEYSAVVLQEQSTRPLDNYSGFLSGARKLVEKITSSQGNCRIYLYSTWGYEEEAAARQMTVPEMEGEIRKAYQKAAAALDVKVSYVGKAFSAVYTQYPQYNLYHSDGKHQSYTGAFLSACVHAATILNLNPETLSYTGKLDAQTAEVLKSAAQKAVNGD